MLLDKISGVPRPARGTNDFGGIYVVDIGHKEKSTKTDSRSLAEFLIIKLASKFLAEGRITEALIASAVDSLISSTDLSIKLISGSSGIWVSKRKNSEGGYFVSEVDNRVPAHLMVLETGVIVPLAERLAMGIGRKKMEQALFAVMVKTNIDFYTLAKRATK